MSTGTIVRLAAGLLLISGCKGGEKLPTVPVTGAVTYNGSAVEGAAVTLISKDPDGRSASGTTDAQGQFKLQTFMGGNSMIAGAMPGDYSVTVRKRESTTDRYRPTAGGNADGGKLLEEAAKQAPPAPTGGRPGQGAPPPDMMRGRGVEGKSLIPEKYENVVTSGLTATVKPSGNDPLKFELTD